MLRNLAVLVVLYALSSDYAVSQNSSSLDPAITGYITRAVSLSDFDVDGITVVSTATTMFMQSSGTNTYAGRSSGGKVYLGERVAIFGEINRKKHHIQATEVIFFAPESNTLSGLALVDRILKADKPDELLLRADGYVIRVNKTTNTNFAAPLASLSDIATGTWIAYHGTLDASGVLTADQTAFQPNTVSDNEAKFVGALNYDASSVPDDAKQNGFAKYVLGITDPKKIPPYHDPEMQARVDRIGNTLIPEFQKALTDTDPRKIHFQFQLIDGKKWKDALSLPSGIILVPHQMVERLQNDTQLATVLADNIAGVIEKQSYRLKPASTTLAIISSASTVGGFFVPGLGFGSVATGMASHNIQTNLLNQSGRVGLGYLHDAGYDVSEAPVTWWLLAAKSTKTLASTTLPPRSQNLYKTVGTVWTNYPEAASVTPTQQTPSAAARGSASEE